MNKHLNLLLSAITLSSALAHGGSASAACTSSPQTTWERTAFCVDGAGASGESNGIFNPMRVQARLISKSSQPGSSATARGFVNASGTVRCITPADTTTGAGKTTSPACVLTPTPPDVHRIDAF